MVIQHDEPVSSGFIAAKVHRGEALDELDGTSLKPKVRDDHHLGLGLLPEALELLLDNRGDVRVPGNVDDPRNVYERPHDRRSTVAVEVVVGDLSNVQPGPR